MKSSGLMVYKLVSKTIIAIAILKLKNTSRINAGKGKIIIASIRMMRKGAANARVFMPFIQAGKVKLFMLGLLLDYRFDFVFDFVFDY